MSSLLEPKERFELNTGDTARAIGEGLATEGAGVEGAGSIPVCAGTDGAEPPPPPPEELPPPPEEPPPPPLPTQAPVETVKVGVTDTPVAGLVTSNVLSLEPQVNFLVMEPRSVAEIVRLSVEATLIYEFAGITRVKDSESTSSCSPKALLPDTVRVTLEIEISALVVNSTSVYAAKAGSAENGAKKERTYDKIIVK